MIQKRTTYARVREVIRLAEGDPDLLRSTIALPRPLELLKADLKKNPESSCRLSISDDLTTTAFFYLDRPEETTGSCLTNEHRRQRGWKWPVVSNGA